MTSQQQAREINWSKFQLRGAVRNLIAARRGLLVHRIINRDQDEYLHEIIKNLEILSAVLPPRNLDDLEAG